MYDDHAYCDECDKHDLACYCIRAADVADAGEDEFLCLEHEPLLIRFVRPGVIETLEARGVVLPWKNAS